ncbi:hypothetical protein T09_6916 [Trichinella sp. T9]|nr:hypothetical protein T09_6034 [Trichinella sp. T9]KRX52543.1 hypothetical protein T09_6916 [Trichinella sp. T9]
MDRKQLTQCSKFIFGDPGYLVEVRGGTKILAFDQFLVKLCVASSVITLEV